MITMRGRLINIGITRRGTRKDGETFGGDHKAQLLVSEPGDNGTVLQKVVDLRIKNPAEFEPFREKEITVPVGVFAPAKGHVIFFLTGAPSPAPGGGK
jgi:hypothetical protein